ncbi:uncharacterized protein LOC111273633 [Varroa jacobsoni]|uniref:uncharacterized protein LOC111273633 n=1 Tax=Varroa jacobsoni TaxID=62625 RepID=UPI000BF3CF25|nr:uncharacterized protein LOC111273633 [Varroa jacobsoni]
MAQERHSQITWNQILLLCLIAICEVGHPQRHYARILRRTVLPDGTTQITVPKEDAYQVNGRLTAYVPIVKCIRTVLNNGIRYQRIHRCLPKVVIAHGRLYTQTTRSPFHSSSKTVTNRMANGKSTNAITAQGRRLRISRTSDTQRTSPLRGSTRTISNVRTTLSPSSTSKPTLVSQLPSRVISVRQAEATTTTTPTTASAAAKAAP